ncbi:MAG TPA: rRNA maturation RNase YbeY, partial [Bacillota bacterium]
ADDEPLPPRAEVRRLVRRALAAAVAELGWPREAVEVTLTLTGDEGIRTLNRRFRDRDRPTDVLSFPLLDAAEVADLRDGRRPPGYPPALPLALGDIVLNLREAVRAAARYGHSPEREIAFLAVHGFLHLLGFDHDRPEAEARMQALTEAALARIGLRRDAAGEER